MVNCNCGKDMERTGGVFGGEICFETWVCRPCDKAVNVYDIKPDFLKE